ncbi:uncharacterized protein PHALS_14948 [Plasmopara halstedii]|uniref:Uncharacterized protein n=1 Tax=Plasmopara halstedii TaxID=4781 RepID=A0A0P1AYV1_PLAHL|nr:uncharacterized protein PHALS_14948 [Plasmopara halstedii]CEG46926.1 hypothetical protein PHALS_14948 [Plasmopara halstedii]|eukprot:XP_024583295.1 hypothetical protein PHALS_14948 [Plasmopara halstedii]
MGCENYSAGDMVTKSVIWQGEIDSITQNKFDFWMPGLSDLLETISGCGSVTKTSYFVALWKTLNNCYIVRTSYKRCQ